jgi:hypothetical protein
MPKVDAVMDTVVSPIIFRSLFGAAPITSSHAQALVSACLKAARRQRATAT